MEKESKNSVRERTVDMAIVMDKNSAAEERYLDL